MSDNSQTPPNGGMKRKIVLPSRSRRFGVGKEIGGSVYVHRSYGHLLGEHVTEAQNSIPPGFPFSVIKYNLKTNAVTFIVSEDFDTAPEPTVGDLWTVRDMRTARFRAKGADPYVYHHKWLMVPDEYPGFDVAASRDRSRQWMTLDNIDYARIGKRSYWEREVLARLD